MAKLSMHSRTRTMKRKPSAAMLLMPIHLKELGENPTPEFQFCPTRRFRSDFALVEKKILIEIDGGVFINGGHTRGAAFMRDCGKHNLAGYLGYRVFRFIPKEVETGYAKYFMEAVLSGGPVPELPKKKREFMRNVLEAK
jgi:hypothetical protein